MAIFLGIGHLQVFFGGHILNQLFGSIKIFSILGVGGGGGGGEDIVRIRVRTFY